MISFQHPPDENFVEVHAAGKLSREDYENVTPQLERLLNDEQPLGFLVQLDGFKGWEPGAVVREIAFDAKHRSQFGRMAVVGDSKLTEWATQMSNVSFPSEVRYFSREQTEEARAWLRSPPTAPAVSAV